MAFDAETYAAAVGQIKKSLEGAGSIQGKDGTTFTPSVNDDGYLVWTNNGGLTNPDPIKIVYKDVVDEINDQLEQTMIPQYAIFHFDEPGWYRVATMEHRTVESALGATCSGCKIEIRRWSESFKENSENHIIYFMPTDGRGNFEGEISASNEVLISKIRYWVDPYVEGQSGSLMTGIDLYYSGTTYCNGLFIISNQQLPMLNTGWRAINNSRSRLTDSLPGTAFSEYEFSANKSYETEIEAVGAGISALETDVSSINTQLSDKVLPQYKSATFSKPGWYRVAKKIHSNTTEAKGASSYIVDLNILKTYQSTPPETHKISIGLTLDSGAVFANEMSLTNPSYHSFKKIRVTVDTATSDSYIEVYYADSVANQTMFLLSDNISSASINLWNLVTAVPTEETVDGVTVLGTHEFSQNKFYESEITAVRSSQAIPSGITTIKALADATTVDTSYFVSTSDAFTDYPEALTNIGATLYARMSIKVDGAVRHIDIVAVDSNTISYTMNGYTVLNYMNVVAWGRGTARLNTDINTLNTNLGKIRYIEFSRILGDESTHKPWLEIEAQIDKFEIGMNYLGQINCGTAWFISGKRIEVGYASFIAHCYSGLSSYGDTYHVVQKNGTWFHYKLINERDIAVKMTESGANVLNITEHGRYYVINGTSTPNVAGVRNFGYLDVSGHPSDTTYRTLEYIPYDSNVKYQNVMIAGTWSGWKKLIDESDLAYKDISSSIDVGETGCTALGYVENGQVIIRITYPAGAKGDKRLNVDIAYGPRITVYGSANGNASDFGKLTTSWISPEGIIFVHASEEPEVEMTAIFTYPLKNS